MSRFWVALVWLFAVASSGHAWLFTLPGSRETAARGLAIAPDDTVVAAGDFAAGALHFFTVARLHPDTGDVEGFYIHDPTLQGSANAVAMLGDDAMAAGETSSPESSTRFLVTRSDRAGIELWATALDGTASCGPDAAHGVALDGQGHPVAVGQLTNATRLGDVAAFVVVKLDAASGSVTWRTEIPEGVARAVVLEGANPIVAGVVGGLFTVVKLDGATGDVVWQTDVSSDSGPGEAVALALGPEGTVYVAGQVGGEFAVVQLETDTGTSLFPGGKGILPGGGVARGVATLTNGDAVATGEVGIGNDREWITARFAAGDGAVLWQDVVTDVLPPAAGFGVARTAADDVMIVGTSGSDGSPSSFAARSVVGQDASLRWGNGIVSQEPETRALTVLVDDAGDVLIGGQLSLFGAFAPSFTVRKLVGIDGSDYEPRCGNDQIDDGEQCDDGNTFDGDCCSSRCAFESPTTTCDDDFNDCTADRCDGEGTCIHPALPDFTTCDDDDDCTVGEACFSGECGGGDPTEPGSACEADFNVCTDDACDGQGNCIPTPNQGPCDDFNPCTANDACTLGGACFGTPLAGTGCDDFNPCTANDTCRDGFCSGTLTPGLQCFSDGNPCTDDVCGVEGFCQHPSNTAPCDDADACTTADRCENGFCTGTPGGGGSTTTSTTSSTTTSSSTSPSTTSTSTTSTTTTSTSTSSTTGLPTTTSSSSTSSSTSAAPTTTTSTTTTTTTSSSTTVPTTSSSSTAPSTSTTTTTTSSTSTTSSVPPPTTTTSTSTTTTTILPGGGCADGTREGLADGTAFPDVAACAGAWEGHVSNGAVLCEEGWRVCTPDDGATLQTVTYQDATGFAGCFAYDAAQDNFQCLPCRGDAATDDMAGMGQGCGFYSAGAGSCISGGRVDAVCCSDYASGTACQYKPELTTGVVCCRGGAPTTTSSTTTSSTTAPPASSSTTSPPASTTTTTTLPAACDPSADCDDGDPCNGGEACSNGRCLAARGAGPACDPADQLALVTRFTADAVDVVNVATRTVEATIPVGRSPWGVAWLPGGTRALVTNRDAKSVSVLDVAARTVAGTITVGRQPLGIAAHPFLARAYVTSYDEDAVDVLDTATLAVVDRIPVGNGPAGLAVHPAGGELYVANYLASTVSVVDLATGRVTRTVATPALPVGVAVHPAGTKVYVACLKGRAIAVVGTVSGSLLATIRTGRRPVGVDFDAAGDRAWVTNSRDDSVTVIDAATDRSLAEIPVGAFPLGVAIADDGDVWVASSGSDACAVVEDDAVAGSVPASGKPVSIGRFIGTPPDDCPAAPLPCDDANPYTGDACTPGVGCAQTDIGGIAAVRAGVSAIQAVVEDAPEDPLAAEVGAALPALQSALAAAETGPDRAALRLLRRTLKPILAGLERARRRGELTPAAARLLDVAREAKRQVKELARQGG